MVLFAHFLIERITIVERQINVDWIAVPIYIRDGAFRIQITCFWTIRIVQRIFIFGVFTIQYAFYCIKVAGPIFQDIIRGILTFPRRQSVIWLFVPSARSGITAVSGRNCVCLIVVSAFAIIIR